MPNKLMFGSRRTRARVLGLLLSCGAVLPSVASAQDPPADQLQIARQKFRQAISLQTGGNWAAALALFREVASIKNTPQVRFNIAICEENMGQLVVALGDYQLAAAQARDEGNLQVAGEVEARLEGLQARIPKVSITLGDNARLAKVSIDRVEVGSSMIGLHMPVDPGSHIVEATAKGYEPFEKTVDVKEKDEIEVEVVLVKLPDEVIAKQDAAEAAAGGGPTEPQEPPSLLPAYIAGGIGVASLGASGVFFYLKGAKQDILDEKCPDLKCPDDDTLRSVKSKGQTYAILAPVTLAVGVAGLGAGAALFLMNTVTSSDGTDTGFVISPTPGGVSVAGKF